MLSRVWSAIKGDISPNDGGGSQGVRSNRVRPFQSPWTRFYARKNVWDDIEAMDDDEAIIARGMDHIARTAVQFDEGDETGFRVEGPKPELDLINPLVHNAGLQRNAWDWVRHMFKHGDMPVELVVSGDEDDVRIVNVKPFPYAYQISINKDDKGNVMQGDPKVAMASDAAGFSAWDQVNDYGNLVAAWWPYQIARFSFGRKQARDYSTPMLSCAISASKRLRAEEDGLAIARMTRAFPQRKHHIPVPIGLNAQDVADKIEEYRDNMSADTVVTYSETDSNFKMTRREAPATADTDVYLARHYTTDGSRVVDGDVDNVPADNPYLENLEDVYLTLRRLICALGVPSAYLNLRVGQKAFVDKTSDEERESYLYLCRHVQIAYVTTLRWIFDLQLLLNGRNPMTSKYRIIQPRISPSEAMSAVKIDVLRGTVAKTWAELGIPNDVIAKSALKLSSKDAETWLAAGGAEGLPEEGVQLWSQHAKEHFLCGGSNGAQSQVVLTSRMMP